MLYNDQYDMTSYTSVRDLTMINNQKQLDIYVYNLVLEKAKRTFDGLHLSVNQLTDEERHQFAQLIIECDERDTSECFYESDKTTLQDNISCAYLNLLKNDSLENRELFIDLVKQNTIKKYKSRMQRIIDSFCDFVFIEKMYENGLTPWVNQNNGEVTWSRSA